MSAPVNLNRARKDRARAEAKAQADRNAVRFGRSGAARAADAARRDQDEKALDARKLDDAER